MHPHINVIYDCESLPLIGCWTRSFSSYSTYSSCTSSSVALDWNKKKKCYSINSYCEVYILYILGPKKLWWLGKHATGTNYCTLWTGDTWSHTLCCFEHPVWDTEATFLFPLLWLQIHGFGGKETRDCLAPWHSNDFDI